MDLNHRRHMTMRNKFIELCSLPIKDSEPLLPEHKAHLGSVYDDLVAGKCFGYQGTTWEKTYHIMLNMIEFQQELKQKPYVASIVIDSGEKVISLTDAEAHELRTSLSLKQHMEQFKNPTYLILDNAEQDMREHFYKRITGKLSTVIDAFNKESQF